MLILIMNPLGGLTLFLSTLKHIDPKLHNKIIIRETFFAFIIMIIFMFFGRLFLEGAHISEQALEVSGGIIMLIIALKMIFPPDKSSSNITDNKEPFIVPIAIPMTAGPGALTTVMLFASQHPDKRFVWSIAIAIASAIVGIIFITGRYLSKYLGDRGLIALERLAGMMITAIGVQMLLSGAKQFFISI